MRAWLEQRQAGEVPNYTAATAVEAAAEQGRNDTACAARLGASRPPPAGRAASPLPLTAPCCGPSKHPPRKPPLHKCRGGVRVTTGLEGGCLRVNRSSSSSSSRANAAQPAAPTAHRRAPTQPALQSTPPCSSVIATQRARRERSAESREHFELWAEADSRMPTALSRGKKGPTVSVPVLCLNSMNCEFDEVESGDERSSLAVCLVRRLPIVRSNRSGLLRVTELQSAQEGW